MSGLLDLLNSDLGKQLISGASAQTGASESKTADVLSMAMPLLLGAMKKNASSQEGASGLMGALSGKHDGSILDNLGSILGGGSVDQNVIQDGEMGSITKKLREILLNIQSENENDDFGWVIPLDV